MSKIAITGEDCPLVGVIAEVTGDAIRLKGDLSRALLVNTAALSARLLGRAQSPQALVGRKVKLTRNPLQGDDVHVELVEEVQPRVRAWSPASTHGPGRPARVALAWRLKERG